MRKIAGIPVVHRAKYRQWNLPVYMTYVVTFPDGEQWNRQETFTAHDLDLKLKNMIKEHRRDASAWRMRAMALWKSGETWWKDEAGVEHLILIEEKPRPDKWGINKAGMAEFKVETGENV